jgi:hypothetical protein
MPERLEWLNRLGLFLALAVVTACGKAPAPAVAKPAAVHSTDTVRLVEGDSLRTASGLVLVLHDVAMKLRSPDRRGILRARLTLRDSSGSEERSLRSDEGWTRALGWELSLAGGTDSTADLAIRRTTEESPDHAPASRSSE